MFNEIPYIILFNEIYGIFLQAWKLHTQICTAVHGPASIFGWIVAILTYINHWQHLMPLGRRCFVLWMGLSLFSGLDSNGPCEASWYTHMWILMWMKMKVKSSLDLDHWIMPNKSYPRYDFLLGFLPKNIINSGEIIVWSLSSRDLWGPQRFS